MDSQLFFICFLTFVIHLIGTLAYSVRIAGTRTRRIAISFAMFNILVLVSRISNTFQGPLLAGRVEGNLHNPQHNMFADFQWLLLSASLATVVGAFMIPSCQRFFSRAVIYFQNHRSLPKLFFHCLKIEKIKQIPEVICLPTIKNVTKLRLSKGITVNILLMNVVAVALWTIGVFASLYAGYLDPEVRMTSSNLSSIINGFATIMMFVFIDPHLSVMTDDVVQDKMSEADFRKGIIWLVASRLAGTILAQTLLIPAANIVVYVAQLILHPKGMFLIF